MMPKTWICKNNFQSGSDCELSDSSFINVQWGRLISCLPQLNSIDMVEPNLSLGRSDECDIVIHKSKFLPSQLLFISKVHFTITRDSEDSCIAYITDLSKNGTYVNDELIGRNNKIILQNNDCIAIGDKLRVYIYKPMNYSIDENYLPQVLRKKYVLTRILGKGACGEVRLAYNRLTCEKYAIKKIVKGKNTLSQINNINHPNRIRTEIEILQTLSHPLIVNMEDIIEGEEEVFLVLEYVQGGELSTRLSSDRGLAETNAKFFFYQIALAVQYLHLNGITHRDLKPGNVLLSSRDIYSMIKVTDFGLSNLGEDYEMMKTVCGTWYYIAPEVLNPNIPQYDSQVDVWSMGVILFYMLSKRLPFQSRDKSTLGKLIVTGTYSMDDPTWYEVTPAAKDLVKKMLTVNPRERITINDILNHQWIAQDYLMKFKIDNMLANNRVFV